MSGYAIVMLYWGAISSSVAVVMMLHALRKGELGWAIFFGIGAGSCLASMCWLLMECLTA